MSKRLYVGNLSYSTTSDDLRECFEAYGTVEDAVVLEGRGFGFVTMPDDEADNAVEEANGTELGGRTLTVNEARPRENRGGGGGGGFRRGGGGGGRDSGGYGRGGGGGRNNW